jgi:hypothetical protein
MKTNRYKKVSCPIYVPTGDYCWKWENSKICPQFNQENVAICEITTDELDETINGYLKLPWCMKLKEWEDE